MLSLLEDIVNIDGGSYDKAGVDAVGARIRAFLEEQEIACETIANENFGDALRATVGGPSNSAIMLMGHRDTVFPKGEPTRRPFKIENGKAYGPGVADMKAGLVMNAFVLAPSRSSAARRRRWSGCSPRTRRSARPPAARSSRRRRAARARCSTRTRDGRAATW
jgi:glutamate carboxypeptidase